MITARTIAGAERVVFETRVEMAGLACEVQTNSAALLSTLEGALFTTPGREKRYDCDPPWFSLQVEVTGREESAREAARFRGRGHLVFASFGTNAFVLDLLRREITASVSLRMAGDREFWKSTFFPIAVGILGPSMGVAPLHCACVSLNGRGLLIAGVSGAGKSTLAAALAEAEFDLISDDWTYISGRSVNELRAYGLEVPVKLLPDAVEHFPQLRGQTLRRAMNGEMAFEVDASMLQARYASWSRPTALLFLERLPQPGFAITMVDRCSARVFFERSAERLPGILADTIRQRSMIIGRVTSLPCFLLGYGGPPRAAAQALRNWYEEVWHD
jgi:hypothetical protein